MLHRFYKKAKWMLITVAAPELILGKALADRLSAEAQLRQISAKADSDGVCWTLTHSYFANMGGFRVHFAADLPQNEVDRPSDPDNVPQDAEIQDFGADSSIQHTIPAISDQLVSGSTDVLPRASNSSHTAIG